MRWPGKWRRRRLGAVRAGSAVFPARAYLGGRMSPCSLRGWRWPGGGRRGVPGRRSASGQGGRGSAGAGPRHPGRLSSGVRARRLLPGCMPASAWRSRPESERRVLPSPEARGAAASAHCRVGLLGPASSPGPARRRRRALGVARFVCARRGGGGAGRPGRGRRGGRGPRGGGRERRRRCGPGLFPSLRGRTFPASAPVEGWAGVRTLQIDAS